MGSLENKILLLIENIYNCIFKGKVIVSLDNGTYTLQLILNSAYAPIYISFEGTEEEFLKFLEKDLKRRRLDVTEYYSGYKYESGGNY